VVSSCRTAPLLAYAAFRPLPFSCKIFLDQILTSKDHLDL
jgi:hypothetical protein